MKHFGGWVVGLGIMWLSTLSWWEVRVGWAQTIPQVPAGVVEPPPGLPSLPDTLPPDRSSPLLDPIVTPNQPVTGDQTTIRVTRVEVLGSTVFSAAELRTVVAPFEGRNATFEELLAIRTAITDLYTSRGYGTSGAFLPPQTIADVANGVIKIQVVEGELERVEIRGLGRLQESYVRDRVLLASQAPLNLRRLESALQLLQQDPLLDRVQAELITGTAPGRSIMILTLQESSPWDGAITLHNRESPSVGSLGGSVVASYQNLSGRGDRLSTEISLTEGTRNYAVNYAIPLNARAGELSLRYTNNTSRIVEQPFARSDINSRSQSFSLGFRQPIFRAPNSEFGLGLSLDWRESRTFLLGDIPFSFSVGPESGRSTISVIRFSQDWVERSPDRVLAARSQFSLGTGLLGATVNNTSTDGQFFSWIGQFQWVQAFDRDIISIVRVSTQITGDSLLPLEQFSLGGIDTVRGYRQNQQVGDNGAIASLEVRFPIARDTEGKPLLRLAPFFDIGAVWSQQSITSTLASVGMSLQLDLEPSWSARLDWGIPLSRVNNPGGTLQDSGIFLSIQFQPF